MPAKLILKACEARAIPGGIGYLLCDVAGVPLPFQRECVIRQQAGEVTTVTITFAVDGEQIIIDPGD